MQKFFTQTLESLFIQNLISSTPLPIFSTVRYGDFIIKGKYYIYKHEIIKCTKTGVIKDGSDLMPLYPSNTLYPRNDLYPSDGVIIAEYENILRYEFGKYYPKISFVYQPTTNYYDAKTHYYLGQYLRCLRDLYDVDYMPFYNCYNATNINNVILGTTITEQATTQKLIAVPIKYNTTYTIAINADRPTQMQALKYSYKLINEPIKTAGQYDMDQSVLSDVNTFEHLGVPGKNKLYYKSVNTKSISEIEKEKFLYLCFQSDNIDGLSVIEGKYTQAETKAMNYVYSDTAVPSLTSKLSLLDKPHDFYAFSDRLVEALLHNMLNRQDEIYWNIGMLQGALGKERNNIWDDRYSVTMFNEYLADKNNELSKYDINGMMNKDVEFYLFKGMN